jgi:hypothetical protein
VTGLETDDPLRVKLEAPLAELTAELHNSVHNDNPTTSERAVIFERITIDLLTLPETSKRLSHGTLSLFVGQLVPMNGRGPSRSRSNHSDPDSNTARWTTFEWYC